jgi:hypothetical protein
MEKKDTISVAINWFALLSFVVFFMYGIYGFLTVPSFNTVTSVLISICLLFLFIGMLVLRTTKRAVSVLHVTKKQILIFCSYFLLAVSISWKDLFVSIDGDQLYHAQQAMVPARFMVQFFLNHFSSLVQNIPYVYFLWGGNILLLGGSVVLYFLVKKIPYIYTCISLSCLFLVSRFFVLHAGGNGMAFPTFRLFPLWVSSTFLSPSSFGFRMATFFGLVVLMVVVHHFANKKLPNIQSYLLGLFAGTIPLLLHVGTLVEMSLWASFCILFVLYIIDAWSDGEAIDYCMVISVVVIFSCIRVSGFVTLIPILGMMYFDFLHTKISKKEAIYALIPILVLVPVIFASVYVGTPSSYRGLVSLNPYIEAHASLVERLKVAIFSGTFFTNVYDSIRFPLVIFLVILPMVVWKNIKKALLVIPLFLMYFVLFYSIEPELWGHGRYQAEYIIPFIVYSTFLFTLWVGKKYHVAVVVLCLCVISNLYFYTHMSEMNLGSFGQDTYSTAMKKRDRYFAWSELSYNFKEALQSAKNEGFGGRLYYSPGNGYGYFAEVLSGYSVNEIQQEKIIVSGVGVDIDSKTADRIISNKNIELVIINGSKNNKESPNEKMVSRLQKNGWIPWKEFTNEEFGTTMYGFRRPH